MEELQPIDLLLGIQRANNFLKPAPAKAARELLNNHYASLVYVLWSGEASILSNGKHGYPHLPVESHGGQLSNISGAHIDYTELRLKAKGLAARETYLGRSVFAACELPNLDLSNSSMNFVQFINSNLQNLSIDGSQARMVSFEGCNLRGMSAKGVQRGKGGLIEMGDWFHITNCDLTNVDLSGISDMAIYGESNVIKNTKIGAEQVEAIYRSLHYDRTNPRKPVPSKREMEAELGALGFKIVPISVSKGFADTGSDAAKLQLAKELMKPGANGGRQQAPPSRQNGALRG
jgi:hypothetical protein